MAEKRSIPVQILGHEYRVRSDGDDRTVLRAAALLDETMTRVQGRTRRVDTLDVAILAALNIANRLVSREDSAGGSGSPAPPADLRELTELVEAALEPGGAPSA